jgi:C_GCAxxG_C_C family probable redox protein
MERVEAAVAAFRAGYSCSQAVLSAYAGAFGLNREMALRLTAGLGGGMGRLAETCGAVSGAILVLGLRYGSAHADDRAARELTYARVREFVARFRARHGSVTCRDLLGCDISTPEGWQQAKDQALTTSLCPRLVQEDATILEELISVAR